MRIRPPGQALLVNKEVAVKMKVEVYADVPHGVSKHEWCEYVRDSVAGNIGMYAPEDPIFHLDRSTVEVRTPRIHVVAD